MTISDKAYFMSPVVLYIEYKVNAYLLISGGHSSLALVSEVFESIVLMDLLELKIYSILP
jgi:hypothetical protein